MFISVEERLPDDSREVLVGDGESSYAVAWYRKQDGMWLAAVNLLNAYGYPNDCEISLSGEVVEWCEIPASRREIERESHE